MHRRSPWTKHEAEAVAWLRLRSATGTALGVPHLLQCTSMDLTSGQDLPVTLRRCSRSCLARLAPPLMERGVLYAQKDRTSWRIAAAPSSAVEACWNLVPAFHGRWGTLWDLACLEEGWGTASFLATAAEARLQREAETTSELHRPRHEPPELAGPRFRALAAEGWLERDAGAWRLAPVSQDSLTLLRLATGPAFGLAPRTLDRIGRIRPPQRVSGGG